MFRLLRVRQKQPNIEQPSEKNYRAMFLSAKRGPHGKIQLFVEHLQKWPINVEDFRLSTEIYMWDFIDVNPTLKTVYFSSINSTGFWNGSFQEERTKKND